MADDRATWSGNFEALRDYRNISAVTLEQAIRFVIEGHTVAQPGDFLTAVFTDSLQGAFQHGDPSNLRGLWALVTWVYNRAPASCRREGFYFWKGLRTMFVGDPEGVEVVIAEWRKRAIQGTQLEELDGQMEAGHA